MTRLIPLLFLLLATTGALAGEREVTVATLDFPPYVSEQLEGGGWAWEVAVQALARHGYRARLKLMPWARAVKLTRLGAVDALYMANINPERRQWAVFSDPVGEERSVGFKRRAQTIRFNQMQDLRGLKIATLRGAHVMGLMQGAGLHVHEVTDLTQGIKLLFLGRIDLFVADQLVTRHKIQRSFPAEYMDAIDHIEPPLDRNRLHLAVSRQVADHLALRAAFNQGLAAMRADGSYDAILRRYGF